MLEWDDEGLNLSPHCEWCGATQSSLYKGWVFLCLSCIEDREEDD